MTPCAHGCGRPADRTLSFTGVPAVLVCAGCGMRACDESWNRGGGEGFRLGPLPQPVAAEPARSVEEVLVELEQGLAESRRRALELVRLGEQLVLSLEDTAGLDTAGLDAAA